MIPKEETPVEPWMLHQMFQ